MKIGILTDSSYGGPKDKYKNLEIVPLMINRANGDQLYDNESLTADDFYSYLEKEALKTSQTITGDMLNKYDEMLKKYDQILVLLLSKELSGQYQTALMLANDDKYKDKIFVVDTNAVSIVLEHFVDVVHRYIEKGMQASEIKEHIESISLNYSGLIVPKNLDTLVRGGRISKAAASLAKMLKITPILRLKGGIDKFSKERTFKKAIISAIKQIKSEIKQLKKVSLTYSRASVENIELVKSLILKEGLEIELERDLPNVIVAHTGSDTFAIISWPEEVK